MLTFENFVNFESTAKHICIAELTDGPIRVYYHNLMLQVGQLEGVYSVQEPHFWTLCSDVYVGSIKVEVSPKADAKYITSQTHGIFTQV